MATDKKTVSSAQKVIFSLSSKGQIKTAGMTLPNKWTDLSRTQAVRTTLKSGKSLLCTSLGCGIWAKDNDVAVIEELTAYIQKMGGPVAIPVTVEAALSLDTGKKGGAVVDGDF